MGVVESAHEMRDIDNCMKNIRSGCKGNVQEGTNKSTKLEIGMRTQRRLHHTKIGAGRKWTSQWLGTEELKFSCKIQDLLFLQDVKSASSCVVNNVNIPRMVETGLKSLMWK